MVDLAGAHVVAVLTRAPSAGGKSRLFAGLGVAPDRRLLEALLLDTIDGVRSAGVPVVIAVTPGSAGGELHALLGRSIAAGIEVMPQPDGDLGERMRGTMTALFARGASAVALVGSDLPHIPPSSISAAFDALVADPEALVLGPATDGGYYLIAATRVPAVFTGIEWGTARVLEQTLNAARVCGTRTALLAPLDDVDTPDALRRVAASGRGARTTAWTQQLPT